jgi:hypothetical protein
MESEASRDCIGIWLGHGLAERQPCSVSRATSGLGGSSWTPTQIVKLNKNGGKSRERKTIIHMEE